MKLPSLIDNTAVSDNLLAQIDAWLAKISKGVRIISTLDEKADSAQIAYQFEVDGDFTPSFSAVNVGFGLTYILPILTAVLSSKPGDLLILENPESHLHPSGQSAIGYFLALAAQDGVQIIVETHSDHIIHGVRIAAREHAKNIQKGISSENVKLYYLNRKDNTHQTALYQIGVDSNGKLYQLLENGKKNNLFAQRF